MLIEIALILVSGNVLKHTSILHVMAVQHIMQGRKICLIGIVQKNRARRALLPVQVTVQVIIIVLPLNHRIIDLCSRNLNPGNDVWESSTAKSIADTYSVSFIASVSSISFSTSGTFFSGIVSPVVPASDIPTT